MTDYRLCKRKISFYILYLPSFFLVFYISQKLVLSLIAEEAAATQVSEVVRSKKKRDTKFRVNTVTLLSLFFDSLLRT